VSVKEILESTPLLNPAPVHQRVNINDDQPVSQKNPKVANRLKSLDIFRGLTMVGMILVDNQGKDSTNSTLNLQRRFFERDSSISR
jgi:hypothetical protein